MLKAFQTVLKYSSPQETLAQGIYNDAAHTTQRCFINFYTDASMKMTKLRWEQ